MAELKFKNGKLKIMHITDTHLDDDNIDGALVGGASLQADSFIEMVNNIEE